MRLLLDTATFLWLALADPNLSATARAAFENPSNQALLSPVSVWEIAVKYARRRLPLPEPPADFVPKYRRLMDIESLPLDEESVLQLARLPERHRDPFDRMLVCQAIAHGLAILTADWAIRQYPVRTIW